MCCDLCGHDDYSVRRFTTRDKITDNYTGTINLCKDCVEGYEELSDEVLCEED